MNRAFTYLTISMGLSFVAGVLFVIMMTLTLPESDMAHGQMPFQDPLVFPVMMIGAGISGMIGWPFFLILGRCCEPATVAKITGTSVILGIVIGTPFHPVFGWPGSYLICLLSLIYCFFRSQAKNEKQTDAETNPASRI